MKRAFILHPFLFAVFPILALYAQNTEGLSISETFIPIAVAIGCTLALLPISFLMIGLILRVRKPPKSGLPYKIWDLKKAGIVTSIFIVLFFSYGHVVDAINFTGLSILTLIVWVVLFGLGGYFTVVTVRNLHNATNVLNVIGITLLLISSISIGAYELKRPSIAVDDETPLITTDSGETNTAPDIYYIILDGYASNNTLAEFCHFDNHDFTDYLSSQGFYVASQSASNYSSTNTSLPSTLNMSYINYLSEDIGEEATDLHPLYDLLQNHKVWQFLESRGYHYVHVGSYWTLTWQNRYADTNFTPTMVTEFRQLLYTTTILREFPSIANKFGFATDLRALQVEFVLYQFDKLAQIPDLRKDIGKPIFVFAHVTIPHPPFVFDPDGRILSEEESATRSNEENYLNQLIFCNEEVRELVDRILSESENSPIIILQGDHGVWNWGWSNWENLDKDDQTRVGMRILNAYHLPSGGSAVLYESISPVNTFRAIFNFYFDADFELLGDESYLSLPETPYKFVNVTEKVKHD